VGTNMLPTGSSNRETWVDDCNSLVLTVVGKR
jgi:hypothetical protein